MWVHFPAICLLGSSISNRFKDLITDAKSRSVRVENPNWRAIIKLERQVASILVIKGRVSEAQEIERRIASMAEVVFDEGEE